MLFKLDIYLFLFNISGMNCGCYASKIRDWLLSNE